MLNLMLFSAVSNGYIYVIVLGVALVIVIFVLIVTIVMFMYFCIHTKSSRVHSKPQGKLKFWRLLTYLSALIKHDGKYFLLVNT